MHYCPKQRYNIRRNFLDRTTICSCTYLMQNIKKSHVIYIHGKNKMISARFKFKILYIICSKLDNFFYSNHWNFRGRLHKKTTWETMDTLMYIYTSIYLRACKHICLALTASAHQKAIRNARRTQRNAYKIAQQCKILE